MDVLTLNYNDANSTIQFVNHIKKYDIISHILIVDNCSTDDSYQKFQLLSQKEKKIILLRTPYNGGYGYGNNYGMRYLSERFSSRYVLQCNPDVIIDEDVIQALEQFLVAHSDYAIVAPFMLDKEGEKVPYSAFPLATKWQYIWSLDILCNKFLHLNTYDNLVGISVPYKRVDAVAGSLIMYDLKKMIHIGMYDENIFLYCEEMSLGLKLKAAGYKTALLPQQTFIHNHSVSIDKTFKTNLSKRKLLVNSKLYVIKNFYKANILEHFIAICLSRLSFFEIQLISVLKIIKNSIL
ncbi:glycosyltransferase [uncultured Mitsuokella sp.]|uniref:glycosyltransferase n=1 Tax=uncultured Mitsuokella sp. TaxID=453120 RepID=UPI00266CBFC3|nr:glycosyltransferase [uncultured Mitsuokella sp.]